MKTCREGKVTWSGGVCDTDGGYLVIPDLRESFEGLFLSGLKSEGRAFRTKVTKAENLFKEVEAQFLDQREPLLSGGVRDSKDRWEALKFRLRLDLQREAILNNSRPQNLKMASQPILASEFLGSIVTPFMFIFNSKAKAQRFHSIGIPNLEQFTLYSDIVRKKPDAVSDAISFILSSLENSIYSKAIHQNMKAQWKSLSSYETLQKRVRNAYDRNFKLVEALNNESRGTSAPR